MNRPEPTRLVSTLALAYFSVNIAACQRADPQAAPPSTSAPQASSAPAAVPSAPPPAAPQAVSAGPVTVGPVPSSPPSPAISSVLVVGDSLSDESVGGGGYLKLLRERCPSVAFDNRAKGGFMVNQMRKRLEEEVLPQGGRYSHAIVFGGVNDLYSDQTANRTLARIESDLTRMYAMLSQRGVRVIAVTVTPWAGFSRWYTSRRGANTRTLNGWIVEQAQGGSIAGVVDAYPLLSCGDPERLCAEYSQPFKDGLHFGKLGHEKLAKALLDGPFHGCQ